MQIQGEWLDAIRDNTTLPIQVGQHKILVCNADGQHYAIENRCSHQDTPLENGQIRHGHISCPMHGVRFDLATGEPKGELTKVAIKTYVVEQDHGKFRITVS